MVWFKHPTFVSYRHGQYTVKRRFIEEFAQALAGELELLTNERLFVDFERLAAGTFVEKKITRAVYESASMVVVYQPNYFDAEYPYCTREYLGMRRLEETRLAQIDPALRDRGLIIPVILRGPASVPEHLRQRQYEDFSRFMLCDVALEQDKNYGAKIRSIAEDIHSHCKQLAMLSVPPFDDISFELPSDADARVWLQSVGTVEAKFPGPEA